MIGGPAFAVAAGAAVAAVAAALLYGDWQGSSRVEARCDATRAEIEAEAYRAMELMRLDYEKQVEALLAKNDLRAAEDEQEVDALRNQVAALQDALAADPGAWITTPEQKRQLEAIR